MHAPRRSARPFAATGAVAVVAVALTLVAAAGASAPARAEPAAAFSNGRAKAHAQVVRIAPGVGNLDLGIVSGAATAEVVNSLAQAQAKTLDLGLIGTSLTAEQCDGSPGPVRENQLPQATQVDNRSGDAAASTDSYPIAGAALGGGRQSVEATKTPAAHASVATAAGVLGPLATVSGGRSDSTAEVIDGAARQATAGVEMDLTIAGTIQLTGLRWSARHRTGAEPAAEGSFSIAGGSIGDLPLPVSDANALEDVINAALVPAGITVEMPVVQHLSDPIELVRVTPLRITLRDSPAGKTLLGPGLNLTREQRGQLFDALVGVYCRLGNFLLVGDVTVSVASGTGFLIVELGGAEAVTGEFELGNPFGDLGPLSQPGAAPTPELPGAAGAANPVAPAAAAPAPASGPAPTPLVDRGPLERVCESVHPDGGRCTRGLALAVGAAGLAATAAIGWLDWQRLRRQAAALAPTETAGEAS